MLNPARPGIVLSATICLLGLPGPTECPQLAARSGLGSDGPATEHRVVVDDGRVATVVDRQGTALVRPVGRERWSPLRQRALLMPGDLVRTSVRGANALEARMQGGGTLIVGPGSLVELVGARVVRLYRGELSVEAEAGKPAIEVRGPGGFTQNVAKTFVGRAAGGKTQVLETAPRWLTGYKESTTDEWVGSLIAKVDGRDVPLAVGYHKVDAVIRDQIAQTTVEQSFINSTKNRLEGVFYFPLPADASISGFGMWIGGELVEADIVEKQRAREIYEDILRRKKDPGLLEWSGGNLFKARVFPIEPHSEKRIRLRYTQVLPMEGSTVRYRYALRSELLRKRPLRSLGIKVSVASATAIEDVASSTHEVRVRRTEHAASLEFDEQEYTPERDFEATITLDRSAALTVVPHRRGPDGYFMMLLSPPSAASGKWKRDLMPEGKPVELMIVADTSASMDTAAREVQADFIRGLLSMLGKDDHFRLMTADIDVQNYTSDPVAVTDAAIESAMKYLAARESMGWTDLDAVMSRLQDVATAGTVVVYVGDGIGTTGDADPVAFAQRIRRLGKDCKGVVHAVSVASTYEQGVLAALASIGGGSVRSADTDPAQVAYDLLAEAAQPAVKDLQVAFDGLQTARVYPEALPNLPVGAQQVVLGRFLPTGQDQTGRVIVSGTLDGKPVRYTAPVSIKTAEAGNSFIPRLWARRHLDHLLAQGRTAEVKEDIVAFSEEFGIMTPYTSFLVLENDEDRKRYGVERRVGMRDGEKFFAKGRDDATTEILRQQMRQARTYRLQLRLRMLREIADLGRSLHGWSVAHSMPDSAGFRTLSAGRTRFGGGGGRSGNWGQGDTGHDEFFMGRSAAPTAGLPLEEAQAEGAKAERAGEAFEPEADAEMQDVLDMPAMTKSVDSLQEMEKSVRGLQSYRKRASLDSASVFYDRRVQDKYRPPAIHRPNYGFAFLGFPNLSAPHKEPKEPRIADWPADVKALLASLDRRDRIAKADLGFVFTAHTDYLHPLQGRITGWSSVAGLFVGGAWSMRTTGRATQPVTSWTDKGQRGVFAESLGLGRRRPADAHDARFDFPLLDYSTRDFARSYFGYTATLVAMDGGRVKVVLSARKPSQYRMEFVVDRERRVVVQLETIREDKVISTTEFTDFVEKGGQFWARKIEHKDDERRVIWRRSLEVDTTATKECRDRIAASLVRVNDQVFVGHEDPKLADAKQAILVGKAGFADQLRMVTHLAATQRWDEMWTAWQRAAEAMGKRPATDLMRLRLLSISRRGEELKESIRSFAASWVKNATESAPVGLDFLVAYGRQLAATALSRMEQFTLLETLEPVYRRPVKGADPRAEADRRARDLSYRQDLAGFLHSTGRVDEALRLHQQTAKVYGDEFAAVMGYISALGNASDRIRQASVLAAALAKKATWLSGEVSQLYDNWLGVLFYLRDLPEINRVAAEWIERDPKNWRSYHCHLASLMFRNRVAEVATWVDARLGEAPGDEVQMAKLQAATYHALGQGWNMSTNAVEDRWQKPLADLVRRCARTGSSQSLQLANQVIGNWYFRRTDAWQQLRKDLLADLLGDSGIAEMSLPRLAIYMQWVDWGRNAIDKADWQKARDLLKARFAKAEDAGSQQTVGAYVLRVLDAWQEKEQALAFLREWLDAAKSQRETVANNLFGRLLAMDWKLEHEEAAISLVTALQPEQAEEAERERIAAEAIRRLADGLQAARIKATLGPVAELEKLARQERREREKAAKKTARQSLAARFSTAAVAKHGRERRWFGIEQFCFAVEEGSVSISTVGIAMQFLATVPGTGAEEEPHAYRVLRERCALVMAYAATREEAPELVVDTVIRHFETELVKNEKTLDWQYQIFRLLLALDRTDALTTRLQEWIVPAKADTMWRRSLGYLLAERGKLKEAVAVFEGVENADELSPRDYSALATWYLVLGDDARRDTALVRQLRASNESQLSAILNQARNKVRRPGGGLSGALDQQDFRAFEVLLEKASRPENYLWQIQDVYRTCKDFRVLGCLPYGIVGHTSGSVYRFLTRVGQAINEVHEEATCDSLNESIARITGEIKRAIDRRGLLLLTSQVERRAAKVKNAPGDHIAAALRSMRDAFKGDWERGEQVAMAGYLASLGRMEHTALAEEQLRQLRELFAVAPDATGDRVNVAVHYAHTLWNYNKRDDAVDALTVSLDAYRRVQRGVLPRAANTAVSTLVGYLRSQRRFGAGESFLLAERDRQELQTQKNWYTQQLFALYIDCVKNRGEVSLGSGEVLYLAVREQLLKMMWEGATDVMEPAFNNFLSLHATTKNSRIDRAAKDLQSFAEKTLPELAARFVLEQGNRINSVAATLHNIGSKRAALSALIAALEREPEWLRTVNREYWRAFHWTLARYRSESPHAVLDSRLLPIALREMQIDLGRMNWRGSAMFYRNNQHFWRGAAGQFARVANQFIADNSASVARVMFAANYLWNGLAEREAAIIALKSLHDTGRLHESGQWQLAKWYADVREYDNAIALLKPLIDKRPERLDYRVLLVGMHEKNGARDTAHEFMLATTALWKEKKWWNEGSMATLAKAAFDGDFFKEAAEWYEEAVRANERSPRRQWNWRNTRSSYYGFLARAHSKLGNDAAAIDAASAAVVTWGNEQRNRKTALSALHRVIAGVDELDKYVEQWNAKVATSGLDAPLIRKHIGIVFLERGESKKAIEQLLIARELQPNDDEVHTRLLAAYDRDKDHAGAIAALKSSIAMSPMNLDLYVRLAQRLAGIGDDVGTERAYTSMVEVKPNESESHERLAKVRERQRRFPAAIEQWQQVVRVRTSEPTGWLGMARAQIEAGRYDDADRTIKHVLATEWEARFKNAKTEARGLQRVLSSRRG